MFMMIYAIHDSDHHRSPLITSAHHMPDWTRHPKDRPSVIRLELPPLPLSNNPKRKKIGALAVVGEKGTGDTDCGIHGGCTNSNGFYSV